jgi:branched-chain amino acid aminotransferase
MAENKFILIDGRLHKTDQPVVEYDNRAFLYGDGLFETIRASGEKLHFFDEHYERLLRAMNFLGMKLPEGFSRQFIFNSILRLLKSNKIFMGARIRLNVWRKKGGYYSPENDEISWMISTEPLEQFHWELNKQGIIIDVFREVPKNIHPLSNLKTINALPYILAGIYRANTGVDDCLLVNTKGNIIEAISSNLFLVRKNILSTPPLSEGCVDGIMRRNIIRISLASGLDISEHSLGHKDIEEADELFLTNVITGIRWVVGFGNKRYYNKVSRKLTQVLISEIS